MNTVIIIIIAVVVLFFGFQKFMVFKMTRKKGKPAPELSGAQGKAIKNGKTSLFYFYSPSCGACKSMTPVVEGYTKNNPRCFKVDISKDMNTARAFGVMGTPSTVMIEGGIIRDYLVGPKPLTELTQLLESTR
ncbi:MAG: thioredoxin family protein, partial [Spirochaetaceae bacterium]|nr:thioredoxin family protein [Spirochaetaceae bacterium]